ncbi:MAG: hypothetical protein PHS92_03690 [Candidatus Gracilibacteria bacterium]|nr:hypothetical protein [Candidatus Gracilibacteria bacterium]
MPEKQQLLDITDEIMTYLPKDYYYEDNNDFLRYLYESINIFLDKEKYRFAVLGLNMLYLTYLYKNAQQIYFYDTNSDFSKNIRKELNSKPFNKSFDLSNLGESDFVKIIGEYYGFNPREIERFISMPIKHRNDCAHSNGDVYIKNCFDCHTVFINILNNIKSINEKHKSIIKKIIDGFIDNSFLNKDEGNIFDTAEDKIQGLFLRNVFSSIEIEMINDLCLGNNNINNHYIKGKPDRNYATFSRKIIILILLAKLGEINETGLKLFLLHFNKLFLGVFEIEGVNIIDILNYFVNATKIEEYDLNNYEEKDNILEILHILEEQTNNKEEKEVITEKISELQSKFNMKFDYSGDDKESLFIREHLNSKNIKDTNEEIYNVLIFICSTKSWIDKDDIIFGKDRFEIKTSSDFYDDFHIFENEWDMILKEYYGDNYYYRKEEDALNNLFIACFHRYIELGRLGNMAVMTSENQETSSVILKNSKTK